jgi:hypothetical protein
MEFPEIGATVTTEKALELCRHFEIDYLVSRIEANLQDFKSWKFDGCSGLPDRMLGIFTGCNWEDITYKCCLPHDLGYAYGEPENEIEREKVDKKFYDDLIAKARMKKWCATLFYKAVHIFGKKMLICSFSWGFAHK